MAQILEMLSQKYGLTAEKLRNREIGLRELRDIVRREGHTVEVFKALCRMRG